MLLQEALEGCISGRSYWLLDLRRWLLLGLLLLKSIHLELLKENRVVSHLECQSLKLLGSKLLKHLRG